MKSKKLLVNVILLYIFFLNSCNKKKYLPEQINETILEYFTQKDIKVSSFTSLNLNLDSEFANVDPNYILEISSKLILED